MRIALIQTPVEDFYSTPQRTYPLGLTYLAAAVDDLPVEVKILDFITAKGRQTVSLPPTFRILKEYLPYDRSPISAFHSYYHFGTPWQDIESYFTHHHYDLYAISSNFYTYSEEVLKIAAIIKNTNPASKILVGGQNVGPEHSLFTDSENIDFCLTGEGDISFHSFVQALLLKKDPRKIEGIWDRKERTWHKCSGPKAYDQKPAAHLLPVDKYQISGESAIMISTSRGCPMGCRFCAVSRTFGNKLRLKPVDLVIEEMTEAFERGIRAFDIEDDNFTFVRSHCIELLTEITKHFKGKISLYAMNGLSAEHLDEEIIDLLKEAGMSLLNLSIATVSEDQLKSLHRQTSIDHFRNISIYAASTGMKIIGHYISGLPGESTEDILSTMKVLAGLPLILGISPFYYIPGIKMEVPNIPTHYKDARLSRFWPADTNHRELDLITFFRLSRWINYLKNEIKLRNITSIQFGNIRDRFKNDPFIEGLLSKHTFLGMNSSGALYQLPVSPKVLNSFIRIFKDSIIYCG